MYLDDKRYAGPACHPPPAEVKGLPTQRELDAFPRMFTWGELKDIIRELHRPLEHGIAGARVLLWSQAIVLGGERGEMVPPGLARAAGAVRARRAGTWGSVWGRELGHEEGADELIRTMMQSVHATIEAWDFVDEDR